MSATKDEIVDTTPVVAKEEQDEEEVHVPVHDVTATTVTGSRVRRSTQKFMPVEPKADETDEFQPPVGAGAKVKELPVVGDNVCASCNAVVAVVLEGVTD